MSLTIFLALCILGLDFMFYVLFQWAYGDKRRAIARQVAAHRKAFDAQPRRPFLLPSPKAAPNRLLSRTEANLRQEDPAAAMRLIKNAS